MSADKRTPHTDALETLGMIHQHDEKRDAIHLAVFPVEAGDDGLWPGSDIKLSKATGRAISCERSDPDAVGIVDPFLDSEVHKGQRFWLVLYPRTIRSLRHVWEHPAFPNQDPGDEVVITSTATGVEITDAQIADAKAMLGDPQELGKRIVAEIARDFDVTYEWLMDETDQAQRDPSHYAYHPENSGKFEGESLPDRFWDAYADAKGIPRSSVRRENYFTCSC